MRGRVRLCFIGIDVSSQTLEVASSAQAKTCQVANDIGGIEQLVSQVLSLAPQLVVLEATGGYEFEVACALQAAGLAVAVVNPRTARDFARAMGALAKTDALDARMLAAFARVLHQHPERERFFEGRKTPSKATRRPARCWNTCKGAVN